MPHDRLALRNSPWAFEARPTQDLTDRPLTIAPPARCRGFLDLATRHRIVGWAVDETAPDKPVALQILDNGVLIGRVIANHYRPDLQAAGIGNGRNEFSLLIPGGLSPLVRHVIQVKRERDGAELEQSPAVIEAATCFDRALQDAVAAALAGLADAPARTEALAFLTAQTDRLLQQIADADGQREARLIHQQFRRRWGVEAALPAGMTEPDQRALVIDDRLPDASRDAGSQAVLSHIATLRELGYAVSLVAANEMAQSTAITVAGATICATPLYGCVEDVLRRQAGCFDVIYLHRAETAARYLALARGYMPRARIIYSVADLHHLRLARQAAVEQDSALLATSERLKVTEFVAAWSADAVITHSTTEAERLRQSVPAARVHHVVWNVPLLGDRPSFDQRGGVAFIAGFAHTPNRDAATWLVDVVMPLVWRLAPALECLLVGSDMPDAFRHIGDPRVVALGHVADLRRSVFDRVRLTVAPLRFGAGIKGKVLSSLAAGVPCVMTAMAAEGLPLADELQDLVGDDPAGLAARIVRYHDNAAANAAAAASGVDFIAREFCAERVREALRSAIGVG